MKAAQFWILLLGSSFVSFLFIQEIFLSRALNQEQRQLLDDRETISTGAAYENAWKQLAVHIYEASRQDPALAEVLKNEKVEIHPKTAPGAASAPETTPPAPPPASSKIPVAPASLHPVTP